MCSLTEYSKQPRDPRFLPVAGEFSSDSFQKQYGFLADIHSSELKTLRENLKRAKKLLISSPRDLREERQEEVGRLELAVKRAESNVNKDQREMVEKKALSQIAKDERDKRKQGKGGWWMKEGKIDVTILALQMAHVSRHSGQEGIARPGSIRCSCSHRWQRRGQKSH